MQFEVITQIANTHQSKLEMPTKIAATFSKVGADTVKFQVYSS